MSIINLGNGQFQDTTNVPVEDLSVLLNQQSDIQKNITDATSSFNDAIANLNTRLADVTAKINAAKSAGVVLPPPPVATATV